MTNTLSTLVLLLATLGAGASGDNLVPGRGGNYDFAIKVEGTIWQGEMIPYGSFTARFEQRGLLTITIMNQTFHEGTWKQHGSSVYLEMNGAKFQGVIRGERIVGEGSNKGGARWKWDVKRAGPKGNTPNRER